MKKEWRYSNVAILSVRYNKFPSEIEEKSFGERMFMMASLKYMNYLEDEAIKKNK